MFCFPITLGIIGATSLVVKTMSKANWVKAIDENWGPLSETKVSAIPCLARIDLMCCITEDEVVELNLLISM